jgi:hypothetical protein
MSYACGTCGRPESGSWYERCRCVDSEISRRLDAAAATGNVEHYTAVVESLIEESESE